MKGNLLTNANSLKLARLYGFASFTSFHCFLRVQEIPNQKRGCANHAYSNMIRISSPAAPPGGEQRIGPNMDFPREGVGRIRVLCTHFPLTPKNSILASCVQISNYNYRLQNCNYSRLQFQIVVLTPKKQTKHKTKRHKAFLDWQKNT